MTVRGEAAEDNVRFDGLHRLVIDPEIAQNTRREILGDEIGVRQHALEDGHAGLGLEVERDTALVQVHGVVEEVAVPGVRRRGNVTERRGQGCIEAPAP